MMAGAQRLKSEKNSVIWKMTGTIISVILVATDDGASSECLATEGVNLHRY